MVCTHVLNRSRTSYSRENEGMSYGNRMRPGDDNSHVGDVDSEELTPRTFYANPKTFYANSEAVGAACTGLYKLNRYVVWSKS